LFPPAEKFEKTYTITVAHAIRGIQTIRRIPKNPYAQNDTKAYTLFLLGFEIYQTGRAAMSVNKVILVGRLGRDPETRFTGGGQAVANFSVATDETYKDKNGERQKRTEWHKIVVWGKQAEIAQQYLKKGSLIFIEGRIQSREWQDKEGQKRTSFEIVATNFRMLGGKSDGAAAGAGGGASRSGGFGGGRPADPDFEGGGAPEEPMGAGPEISDEDIPF
jgi:single-strand DNA-binding protein